MDDSSLSDEEYEQEVARRVRIVGLVVLLIALGVIGLSALTLKADQVNDLERSPIGGMPEDPKTAAP